MKFREWIRSFIEAPGYLSLRLSQLCTITLNKDDIKASIIISGVVMCWTYLCIYVQAVVWVYNHKTATPGHEKTVALYSTSIGDIECGTRHRTFLCLTHLYLLLPVQSITQHSIPTPIPTPSTSTRDASHTVYTVKSVQKVFTYHISRPYKTPLSTCNTQPRNSHPGIKEVY